MSESIEESITTILRNAGLDDPQKAEKLLPIVYDELRRLARAKIAGFADASKVEPTAIVHDAWIKLFGAQDPGFENRRDFFVAAARSMHNVLVDRARRRGAKRVGGDRHRVDLANLEIAATAGEDDIQAIHDALGCLDESERQIVELRFFAGLDMEETAAALNIPLRTLERDWTYIRARLYRELTR